MSEGAGSERGRSKGQIAFEFLVVYSFVVVIFVVIFLLITSEDASSSNSQAYSALQLIAQDVASYIDAAVYAGNGYNASIPVAISIGSTPYNITISTTGVVIVSSKLGSQVTHAYAYSSARGLVINGTSTTTSTNAIQLYVLNNNGAVQIYNQNGRIFINVNPANISTSLPVTLAGSVVAKGRTAYFDGANSYAIEPGFAPVNLLPKFSVTGWFDLLSSSPNNDVIYSEASTSHGSFDILINALDEMRVCVYDAGSDSCVFSAAQQPQIGQWTFFALTYNGAIGGTGTLNIIMQTNTITKTNWQSENNVGALTSGYAGIGINVGNILGSGGITTGIPFNGFIANLQIYNTTLTQANLTALYNEGFTGQPVNAANLITWYRLAGDTNDYSGENLAAYASNITYQTVEQIGAYGTSSYGTVTSPMTIFTASNGLFTASNSPFFVNFSLGGGTPGYAFLNSNGASGRINLTISEFNGQNGLVSSPALAAWFPLDAGFGPTIDGFSGLEQGNSTVPIALPAVGTFNGFPKWSIANRNATNFLAGSFPGTVTRGFITYPYVNAYNNIIINDSMTVIAWINTTGSSSSQGILSDQSGTGDKQGFLFYVTPGNGLDLGVDANIIGTPAGTVTVGNWVMVTGEYQGNGQAVNLYFNSTLNRQVYGVAGQPGGGLQSQLPASAYMYLANLATTLAGADSFNGEISNVQLYSSFLNQSQISTVYKEGITGLPLSGAGLVGWWPLDGLTNDSSSSQNIGSVQDTVAFANVVFSNYTVPGAPRYVLTFAHAAKDDFYESSANIGSGSYATLAAWVNPIWFPALSFNVYNDIFFAYGPGAAPGANTFEAGIDKGGFPIFSAFDDDYTPLKGVQINWNSWNFVAYVLNGQTQTIDIFVNGAWENGTLADPVVLAPGALVIGAAGKTSPRAFNGSITDLQFYDQDLTPQQILALYDKGLPQSVRMNLSVS